MRERGEIKERWKEEMTKLYTYAWLGCEVQYRSLKS